MQGDVGVGPGGCASAERGTACTGVRWGGGTGRAGLCGRVGHWEGHGRVGHWEVVGARAGLDLPGGRACPSEGPWGGCSGVMAPQPWGSVTGTGWGPPGSGGPVGGAGPILTVQGQGHPRAAPSQGQQGEGGSGLGGGSSSSFSSIPMCLQRVGGCSRAGCSSRRREVGGAAPCPPLPSHSCCLQAGG